MSFPRPQTIRTLALLAMTTTASAQYSTPVGSGAAKPKTLRATAVLEYTGSLEKPAASRLMPVAVWDGERYQPAGLYLASPSPLAFEAGTQYELEQGGVPAGLLDVRAAAQMRGGWIGLAKFKPEAPPPPPPRLKPSKQLPVLAGGKNPDTQGNAPGSSGDRPTLHRKDDSTTAGVSPDKAGGKSDSTASSSSAPASSTGKDASTAPAASKPSDSTGSAPADPDHPTLHRRTDSGGDTAGSGSEATPASTGSSSAPGTAGSDRPTLHRPSDSDSAKSSDDDKPTLHRHADSTTADNDPDRPTLHRARTPSVTSVSIDPDRPHLRYGGSAETADAALPARLNGTPADMKQIVAVSDATLGEQRPYQYHWANPDDAAKMQSALAAIAAKAVTRPTAATTPAQFGPASRPSRGANRGPRATHINLPPTALLDEHFAAYELTFSGGATLVYSAHTAGEGAQRSYVTLIAQPDFNGTPQVLLQQVTRGDRLDETPVMQLVDAVDTDDDNRAELIFQLTGAATVPPPEVADKAAPDTPPATANDGASSTAASSAASVQAAATAAAAARTSAAAVPEREFAIYRVADRKAVQVFTTGPLP